MALNYEFRKDQIKISPETYNFPEFYYKERQEGIVILKFLIVRVGFLSLRNDSNRNQHRQSHNYT